MADSEIETTGMSVASRIRLYQNNAGGGHPPRSDSPKNMAGGQDSPKEPASHSAAQKGSTKLSPASPKPSLAKQGKSLQSSTPSPRPTPRVQQMSKECPSSCGGTQVANDCTQMAEKKTNLVKPHLPTKPAILSKGSSPKDLNDNCNARPTIPKKISNPDFVKRPLVAKYSSDKSVEKKQPSSIEDRKWKRISGPPSRPLPPAPLEGSVARMDFQKPVIPSQRKLSKTVSEVSENVDLVRNDPDCSTQEVPEDDGDYEDPILPAASSGIFMLAFSFTFLQSKHKK